MNMETSRPLVFSIIEFLKEQTVAGNVTDEAAESIEVAIQCLENAYELSLQDPDCVAKYKQDISLSHTFNAVHGSQVDPDMNSLLHMKEASDEEKLMAAECKTKGNEYMKEENFTEALESYNKAINLDRRNAVYYCNRAAAFSKLNRNQESIDDCHRALTIDPSYSKAYGRMGIAHTALNEHTDAQECYRKACELDPENDTYKTNLHISQEKLRQEAAESGVNTMGPGALGGFGGFDMAALMNNPGIMNMATQLMGSPQMQQMMSNMATSGDISSFLSVGQQMAEQMQQSNPELVEQLRTHYQTSSTTENTTQDNPPENKPPEN